MLQSPVTPRVTGYKLSETRRYAVLRAAIALLLAAAPAVTAAQAGRPELHVGGGLYPGTGGVVIVAQPFFSAVASEGALYADYQPRVLGGRGRLLVAAGAGGSVRLMRVLAITRGSDAPPRFDLDAGVRVGPAFYYAFFEQTAEGEARAFRVMFDPFARAVVTVGSWRAFVELGTQGPQLRGGVVL